QVPRNKILIGASSDDRQRKNRLRSATFVEAYSHQNRTKRFLAEPGPEQYEATFHANAVDADVLRDLTDQDLQKLGVLLGDRRKLLRAIAALDEAFAPARAPRPTSLPISLESILAAAATRASPESRALPYSLSAPPHPPPMSSQRRPAEMSGDRSLASTERT